MTSKRTILTKSLLKQGLIELLENKSIDQISITEICEHANVSRSTFYSYYGSQFELLQAIESELISATEDMFKSETNHDEEHTTQLLAKHFQYILDNIRAFQTFSVGSFEDYNLPRRTMRIILIPYIEQRLLWRLPEMTTREFERICLFSTFGGISIVKNWILDGNRCTPKELANVIMKYINAVIEA
jgi:AcrR family transcriptional regulator